ncbi:hypothetical protein NEF87_003129 [Candidatus Lokiarchaeum ossiferum]|uniref:Aldo/keto reductase n=1 Tax=Candidatus Lokiarchaeum ossiferum TaxID=2951803 RepID=A0ABY6HWL0_9ARCH|nr:hypothetical protein NEF87_003129 [Candidatus Lokiarchaeum sp. B-35]
MKYRKLFDEDTSILGFGCMRLPTIKEGDTTKINQPEAIKQIRHGIDQGINYIDTAWPYHNQESEVVVGKALQDGYREKVKLVTKAPVWEYKVPEDFEKYLKLQLEKLQTDHLDIYLLHALSKMRFSRVQELKLFEQAEKAKKAGLIKHFGFSFHGNYETFIEIIDAYDWDVTQIQFNYMDVNSQATEKGLKYAGKKGIPVIVMEPLLGGKLVRQTDEGLKFLNEAKTQQSLAAWALQFVWNYSEVKVVLSGMNTMEMIDENCASADRAGINSLSDEDLATIAGLKASFEKLIYIPCTRCEYCMPCPSGVNIPMNLRVLNEAVWTGSAASMQSWFDGFAQTEEALAEKPNNGAAQLCIECGQCLDKCPQSINIPEGLKKAASVFVDGVDPKSIV